MSEPSDRVQQPGRAWRLMAAAAIGALGSIVFLGPVLVVVSAAAVETPVLTSVPVLILLITPVGLLAGYVASGRLGFVALWIGALAGTWVAVLPSTRVGGFGGLFALFALVIVPQAVLPGYIVARLAVGSIPAGVSPSTLRRLAVYVVPLAIAWSTVGVVALANGLSIREARQTSCPRATPRPEFGGRMLFVGSHALCEADVRTGSVRSIYASSVDLDEQLASPRWSPDGLTIAFVRTRIPASPRLGQRMTEVVLIDSDGSNDRALRATADARGPLDLDWAPDGKRLAITADGPGCSGCAALFVVDIATESWTRVAVGGGVEDIRYPAWAPNAEAILVTMTTPAQRPPVAAGLVAVVSLDGSVVTMVARDGYRLSRADWSPNGSQIALARIYRSGHDVDVVEADGSAARRLTMSAESTVTGGSTTSEPVWSPDGRSLAVYVYTYTPHELPRSISILPVSGGAPVLFIEDGTDPDWAN